MKFPISEKFRKTYYQWLKGGAPSLRTCTRSMNIMYFHLVVLWYAYNRLKRDYISLLGSRQAVVQGRQYEREGCEQEVA